MFGLTETKLRLMEIAGQLHDIGKLVVPNSTLDEPDELTREEFAILRQHAYFTFTVLNTIDGLQRIAEWASYHHEKLDGTGYPFGEPGCRSVLGPRQTGGGPGPLSAAVRTGPTCFELPVRILGRAA